MSAGTKYIENIEKMITELKTTHFESIRRAAVLVAEALIDGKTIHTFGTGHSHMLAEEMFYRAGGLVKVNPILDNGLMLHNGAEKSTLFERLEGYASIIFNGNNFQPGDVLIIASNSGRNAVNIDMALLAKENGVHVVVVTNMKHSSHSKSRHSSGKLLYEVGDVIIDNAGCIGDASVDIDGLSGKVAPTSTVMGALILNAMVAEAVEYITASGRKPEVFASSNVDGGDEINTFYFKKYKKVLNCL